MPSIEEPQLFRLAGKRGTRLAGCRLCLITVAQNHIRAQ